MIKGFKDVLELAKKKGPKTISVAVAQDKEVLSAVKEANDLGIADAILVGDKEEIVSKANEIGMNVDKFEIVDVKDLKEVSRKAVELVSTGKAHMVMKGLVDTSIILKAVLDEEIGLRTGKVLSHVAVFDLERYHKILFVTDAAMNIAPSLEQKKQILENAVFVAHSLDIEEPKVGVVCAKEKVNPKMPDTVDAQNLEEMNKKGEITGCVVGGPFALDNTVSKEAAEHKGIDHVVAGDADILLMPDIEAGNILYKALVFLAGAQNAGVIVGAKAPVVLTSRADSDEAKLNSIALGVLMASNK
ncbi:phosphate butyryltransferase [Caldisalinibacter kiritimatiensis]|uniref:Phosphotransbutyrylase n=1 Tax=Caldisalinibacter kiritimatiensis TaxID=1304284 RepID=R1CBE1_9FIRM|nr:phosphate butyryltransferase [Caldisalinibacter kiritimatiensis]EOC99639.1 phosphotransbutyrylase [Caldisalinibacter kiritimatiensis]